ncbi:MAG: metallophosphoesterase [bacterium]|nr:metallophosphoesterase [bacterium]
MRRDSLPPARLIAPPVLDPPPPHPTPDETPCAPPVARPAEPGEPPPRAALSDPSPARRRDKRRWFDPAKGWFRRLEREVSHFLSRSVFPHVPGLHLPYDAQLRRCLTLAETDIELTGLPGGFDGMRVLLITDVHAGPFLSRRSLCETFRRLLAVQPDVILLGGDLITARVEDFEESEEAFRLLSAPLGVFGVWGNHDHYPDQLERLRDRVESCGVRMLNNRNVELRRGGEALSLAGVDDLLIGEPDLDAALSGTRGPVVLLSHNPDLLFRAADRGVALMLSGHTHAGQIRLPGLPVLVRQSRYRLDQGRYRRDATELVVSRGLGVSGLPLRAACPPEAVLVRLRRSRA